MNNKKVIINYTVQCDDKLNPPEAVARNEYRARLTVDYIEVPLEEIESDNDIR